MANFVRLFQPRFAELVASGRKLQTVRPVPRRRPRPGDTLSLRAWSGKPYRSPQRILATAEVESVCDLTLDADELTIDGHPINLARDTFARVDGFADFADMVAWFRAQHGLPFRGIVITWKNVRPNIRSLP